MKLKNVKFREVRLRSDDCFAIWCASDVFLVRNLAAVPYHSCGLSIQKLARLNVTICFDFLRMICCPLASASALSSMDSLSMATLKAPGLTVARGNPVGLPITHSNLSGSSCGLCHIRANFQVTIFQNLKRMPNQLLWPPGPRTNSRPLVLTCRKIAPA